MWSKFSNIPYRQITRSIVGYQAASLSATARLTGGDATRMIVMMAATKASLLQQRQCAADSAPATINGIAQSLGRRHQTLYNHAAALVDLGLCVQQGHALVPAPVEPVTRWLDTLRGQALAMIDELLRAMVPLPASGDGDGDRSALDRELAIFALRMNLVGVEYNAQESANWTEMCITAVVMAHNVRPLTGHYTRTGGFGHAVAPVDARAPMPMAEAADALQMPYSTLARHVARMTSAGLLDRVDGGLVVAPSWMLQPGVLDRAVEIANYVGRRMHDLQHHGFDFTQPLRHRNAVPPVAA